MGEPQQAAARYLDVFREQSQERTPMHTQGGPRLVYICAPLRGDVEKNIEFARKKAQEVFQAGDIPVCPHLMFPPIADPENPVQDQAAREMGLRLVESCQEIHVYGPEWTEGMWAEIRHAMDLGIEVKDEQERLLRLEDGRQVSLLAKYNFTEQDAWEFCRRAGLLSPVYAFTDRGGCWFCPNAKRKELRHLYDHHPDLWARMLELQAIPGKASEKFNRTQRFDQIDAIFRQEDAGTEQAAA